MPEILTQKDIDALLADGGLGANLAPDVIPWDFAGVPRVPRDRQTVFEAVFAQYAQLLEALFSTSLRTQVGVSLTSVEQVEAREFLLSLESPCAAAVFDAGSAGEDFGVLDFGAGLAFTFLDRMFGGSGDGAAPRRPLTAIEQTVLRSLTERALGLLREAWQGRIQLGSHVTSFESDPGMIQYPDGEDGVVVATLEVRADPLQSPLVLGLPITALESCVQDPLREAAARAQGRDRPAIEASLCQAHVTLSVKLPVLRLIMRDVQALAPGQVIHTGLPMDTPVELHVNDEPCFQGSLGQVQRHVGLRIIQRTATPAFGRPERPKRGRVL